MAGRRVTEREYHGVWCGPIACVKLVQAFMEAPEHFNLEADIGTNDGELLVIITLDGVACAFDPDDLLMFARDLIRSASAAEKLGAPIGMVRDIVKFSTLLIENAEEAKAVSRFGLH